MRRLRRWRAVRDATKLMWKMWGAPYSWGGDDPILTDEDGDGLAEGAFDCSGALVELSHSFGFFSGDKSADSIFHFFKDRGCEVAAPVEGAFVCYDNAARTKVVHIEYCLGPDRAIGFSGGGSKTTSVEVADKMKAYCKIRPIERSRPIRGYVNPFILIT